MKKLTALKKYLPVALAVAAFATAGTTLACAQSFSGAYGTGNVLPFAYAPPTSDSGYSAFAQAPAKSDHRAAHRASAVAPSPRYFAPRPARD